MIEHLGGRLVHKGPTVVHLQVGPIRLEVSVPLSTSRDLPAEGAPAELWIHLQWREDGPVLFGFASPSERELFRLLILVQGVGPRVALSLLSHLSVQELIREIRDRSVEGLTRIPGIGPKTAGRILVDLGPRVDRLELRPAGQGQEASVPSAAGEEDAVQALTALGYPVKEARKAVQRILHDEPALPLSECIRRALYRVGRHPGSE
jgi:holliday junction DNA helicase RuvA